MKTTDSVEGIFAVYKEEGMTSHDVVDAVRRCTGRRRVGHAGTLDPCAKGVLVVGVGRAATKKLGRIAGSEKEYVTCVKLGWRSSTDDRAGDKEQVSVPEMPSEGQLRRALGSFQGTIIQRPPAFSAVKIGGRAAYKFARAGQQVELPAREVEAKEIEILSYAWPLVHLRIVTGPGFYVRSLARDLGALLGTGGYVEELERTRVGPYTKDQAVRLTDLHKLANAV
jgi:tRNA pseudouridine55 synthase